MLDFLEINLVGMMIFDIMNFGFLIRFGILVRFVLFFMNFENFVNLFNLSIDFFFDDRDFDLYERDDEF